MTYHRVASQAAESFAGAARSLLRLATAHERLATAAEEANDIERQYLTLHMSDESVARMMTQGSTAWKGERK